jgi:integrase
MQTLIGRCHADSSATTYLGWAVYLLTGHSASGTPLKPRTIERVFAATVRCLLMLRPGEDPASLDRETLIEVYGEILTELVSDGETPDVRYGLREFHHFLAKKCGVARLENVGAVLGDEAVLRPIDANLISFDEYEATRSWLDGRLLDDWDPDDIHIAKLVLMMGFRLGLRRMEIFGLRLEDIHLARGMTCLVRPHPGRRLKTANSKRLIPLGLFLDWRERKELRSWILRRSAEATSTPAGNGIEYLLALPHRGMDQANVEVVSDRVFRALREVTGDKALFIHHLRHSFGTWTYLRLRAPDYPAIAAWFDHLPRTAAMLRSGRTFRQRLLGRHHSQGPSRVYAYSVARLLGHSGPTVSLRSYIHTADLIVGGIVQREAALIPKPVLVAASGLSPAVAYEVLRRSPQALAAKLRPSYVKDVALLQPRTGNADAGLVGKGAAFDRAEWIPLNTIRATLRQQLNSCATSISAESTDTVTKRDDLAVRAQWLGLRLAPDGKLLPWLRKFKFPDEKTLAPALESALMRLVREKPDLLKQGLSIHLKRFDRQKWDVVFRGTRDLDELRIYLRFINALQLADFTFIWILRLTDKTSPALPSWMRTMKGSHAPRLIRVIAPPTATRATSYAKWVGVKIAGKGEDEGPGRAMTVLCWLSALLIQPIET